MRNSGFNSIQKSKRALRTILQDERVRVDEISPRTIEPFNVQVFSIF